MEPTSEIPRAPADVPGRHITANQLVGYNIARWRKAAEIRQEELGERLGWSNATVSAAERSWDGKRIRQFSADELIAIAQALGVPLAALFLPPDDDGASVRYLFREQHGEMGDLFRMLIADAGADPSLGAKWEEAFKGCVARYLDPERGAALLAWLDEMSSAEVRRARLERIRWQREAALSWVTDLDQMAAAITKEKS